MVHSLKLALWTGAAICFGLLTATPQAHAGFALQLTDGTNTVYVTSSTSSVSYIGTLGAVSVNLTGTLGSNPSEITLAGALGPTTSAETITATLVETGFTSPTGGATLTSTLSGTPAFGTMSFESWENNSDLSPIANNSAFSVPAGSVGTPKQGPFSTAVNNNTASTTFTATSPFSLFDQLIFTANFAGGSMNLSGTTKVTAGPATTPIPAPDGLALALAGLPFAGLFLRRRRARA